MAEELMNRLINAVQNLRETGDRLNNENANRANSQSVEGEIGRLFPSVNALRASTESSSLTQNRNDNVPDRNYVRDIRNFHPSTNYRPKKGKKNESRGQKRKQQQLSTDNNKKSTSNDKPVLRDIVLLPSPKMEDVPRGSKREDLFTHGCVISAFEIRDGNTEEEIRSKMIAAFNDKLQDVPEPKFKFMRAVGNKIVDPACENYNGKVLKYLNKQGPVYIRAVSGIKGLELSQYGDSSNSDSDSEEKHSKPLPLESDADDDILMISPFERNNTDDRRSATKSTTRLSVGQGYSSASASVNSSSSSSHPDPLITEVNCPTCNTNFPSTEIAEHADSCAEAAEGISFSRQTYGNILMEFPYEIVSDADEEDLSAAVENSNSDMTSLKECLESLQKKVQQQRSSIYVRRKLLWEDYVETSKRNKWFKPDNSLRVNFIGEPAVDGGGPKREFFCEALKQMEIRLFSDGAPVNSTISLTEGQFKIAGQLMASSVIQGGPAPNFLARWVYQYLSGGLDNVSISIEDIKNDSLREMAEKISGASSDTELQEILVQDEVMTELNKIGYRRIPTRETMKNKDSLLRCICINDAISPRIPMLKEIEEGLQLYGLLGEIQKHQPLFEPVFTASSCFDMTADDLLQRLVVHFSKEQFLKSKEEDIMKYFSDFVEALYHEGLSEAPELRLKHLLKFITGSETIPPIGFPIDLNVQFKHGCPDGCKCRPTSSTCALVLRLPIHSCTSEELGDLLISSLLDCCGFGNV